MDRKLWYHDCFLDRQMEKKSLWHNTLLGIEANLNRGQDLDFLGVSACPSGSFWSGSSLTHNPGLIGGIPRHTTWKSSRCVQYVSLAHMCTHVVGVGHQEMSRAWECCAGKLSGKSPLALSQLRPLPISLKLDFLLRDRSGKTSVLQLPADTHRNF